MLTPAGKKPGRNDPCWCWSGKKYKHCHLKQDQADARASAAAAFTPPPPPPVIPPPVIPTAPAPAPPSPEQIAADRAWERFKDADLEGKEEIFLERLGDMSLTKDEVFDMLLAVRKESNPREDRAARARFRRLSERLDAVRPELYLDEAGFVVKSLLEDAVAERDWTRIAPLLAVLGENIEGNAEEFAKVSQMLMYHDRGQDLLPVMRADWPIVRNSDELTDWGIQEFANALINLNLFDYLEKAAHPRADDPTLIESLPEGLFVESAHLDPALARLSEPAAGPWQRADFDEAADVEVWETNASLLVWDFMAERRRVAGIPFSRSNLGRDLLLQALHDQIGRPAGGKSKNRKAGSARPLPLIPDIHALDARLGRKLDVLGSPEPYTVAALMELLPAYPHFLARLGLIHPTEMDEALAELGVLMQPVLDVFRSFGGDVHAAGNVEAAWSPAALATLQNDPALIEVRGQPHVIRSQPADPMAKARVYRFKVTYRQADDVWFILDISRNRTLHDLHIAIRDTANFDDDHLYSFYMSGRAWDKDTEYSSRGSRYSSRIKIGDLPLRLKQRFLYLYDYGDQHTFQVQLLGPSPESREPQLWEVVEMHGTMPPQYGFSEEDEEWMAEGWNEDADEELAEDELAEDENPDE